MSVSVSKCSYFCVKKETNKHKKRKKKEEKKIHYILLFWVLSSIAKRKLKKNKSFNYLCLTFHSDEELLLLLILKTYAIKTHYLKLNLVLLIVYFPFLLSIALSEYVPRDFLDLDVFATSI